MKHKKSIGLSILGIVVGSLLVGVVWQMENVTAVWEATQYSERELGQKITETKRDVEQALTQYEVVDVRDLTLEEEEQIRRGELSVEEAVQRIMKPQGDGSGATIAPEGSGEALSEEGTSAEGLSPEARERQIITDYSGQMYALKARYLGVLGGLEGRGRGVFMTLPTEERNAVGLQKIAMPFIQEAAAMEKQCNSEVRAILQNLEKELGAIGADTGIVDTMRQAYETEKRLKKAYYLSLVR